MKKLFFLFVMMVATIGAHAQDIETLVPTEIEVDQMLNPDGGTKWRGVYVAIFEHPGKEPNFNIKCKDHIFDRKIFRIGYYSANDSMMYMSQNFCNTNQGNTIMRIGDGFAKDSIPYSTYRNGDWHTRPQDIMRWLKETDGYLRVLAPVYGGRYQEVKFRLKK